MSMYRSWAWQEAVAHSWFKRPPPKRWRTCVCKVRLYASVVHMSQNVASCASADMKCAFESNVHTLNIYVCMNVRMHACLYAAFYVHMQHAAYVWRLSVRCVVVFIPSYTPRPCPLHTRKHTHSYTHIQTPSSPLVRTSPPKNTHTQAHTHRHTHIQMHQQIVVHAVVF